MRRAPALLPVRRAGAYTTSREHNYYTGIAIDYNYIIYGIVYLNVFTPFII